MVSSKHDFICWKTQRNYFQQNALYLLKNARLFPVERNLKDWKRQNYSFPQNVILFAEKRKKKFISSQTPFNLLEIVPKLFSANRTNNLPENLFRIRTSKVIPKFYGKTIWEQRSSQVIPGNFVSREKKYLISKTREFNLT